MLATKTHEKIINLEFIYETNKLLAEQYKTNPLMQFIKSSAVTDKQKRDKLLDCIQVFSDYFQKTVMLRNALCDDQRFLSVTQTHLREEFEHNVKLMKDRNYREPVWDPVLEAIAAWFTWKMFTLDNEERTVLMHLVLEASAHIFFIEANKVMQAHGETDYFEIHSEVDGDHENMGRELLENLSPTKYKRLLEVQKQGWSMLNAICNRIAVLAIEAG